MKLVRYLKEIKLLKSTKQKQSNGVYIKTYEEIGTYNVQVKNLEDEISATIYGANIDKMLNISDALNELSCYLNSKVDNVNDNISLYFVEIDSTLYKIVSVKEKSVNIERIGTNNEGN